MNMKQKYVTPALEVEELGLQQIVAYSVSTGGLDDHGNIGQGKDDNGDEDDDIFGSVKDHKVWDEEW